MPTKGEYRTDEWPEAVASEPATYTNDGTKAAAGPWRSRTSSSMRGSPTGAFGRGVESKTLRRTPARMSRTKRAKRRNRPNRPTRQRPGAKYAQRFLDQLDRRTIEVAGVHGRMVLMTAIEAAVNNPELFPAPIVRASTPQRACAATQTHFWCAVLCDSVNGDTCSGATSRR